MAWRTYLLSCIFCFAVLGVLLFLGNIVQLLLMFVILVGQQVLAGSSDKRALQTYKDAGMVGAIDDPNRVIHARLSKGSMVIMASDSRPGTPVERGDNFWVCVHCDDVPEGAKFFAAFSDGGTVVIGGVIQTNNSINVAQVPLLGSIPWLGNLFKHTTVSTSNQELIFFITPRIIQT